MILSTMHSKHSFDRRMDAMQRTRLKAVSCATAVIISVITWLWLVGRDGSSEADYGL